MDDVEDRYGGWYDADLSPVGRESAKKIALEVKDKNLGVEMILTSPFKRTYQTAEIISSALEVPLETFVYLKERNSYGLLCGVNKTEAKEKYPDLVSAFENGQEVLGYESYDFLLKRIKILTTKLAEMEKKVIICVTHGKLLGAIYKNILHKETKNIPECCLIETDLSTDGNLPLIESERVEFM